MERLGTPEAKQVFIPPCMRESCTLAEHEMKAALTERVLGCLSNEKLRRGPCWCQRPWLLGCSCLFI